MFAVIKRSYLIVAVLLVLVAVALPVVTVWAIKSEKSKPVIAIDAGHGGYDGGVRGVTSGVREADVNLALAQLLKGYFESDGYTVVLTREKDTALTTATRKQEDMAARVKIVEDCSPQFLISLHVNYYPSASRRGIQVFFTKDIDRKLAETLQGSLNESLNQPTIGRNFSALAADYYLLAHVTCPAALIECGFFSNAQDEALLLDENYRMRLAFEIFRSCKQNYLLSA